MLKCYNDSTLEDLARSVFYAEMVLATVKKAYSDRLDVLIAEHGFAELNRRQAEYEAAQDAEMDVYR